MLKDDRDMPTPTSKLEIREGEREFTCAQRVLLFFVDCPLNELVVCEYGHKKNDDDDNRQMVDEGGKVNVS